MTERAAATAAGHDPERVRVLLGRAADALAELRELTSDDEAADDALRAARLAAHTLETLWLPALRELAGSP